MNATQIELIDGEDFVSTRTGKTVHAGTHRSGAIQTRCGIGYGRRSYGSIVTNPDLAAHCARCAEMINHKPNA